jgi:truncated hemoglobin YjbI
MIDALFETIGGRSTIQAAVQSFYKRVIADDALRHFFDGTDMNHLRARQSMFVSMLLGGKIVYTGRDIGDAHAGSRIKGLTDAHFDKFLQHFREALEEVGVQPDKLQKVMGLLEGTRNTVLNRAVE